MNAPRKDRKRPSPPSSTPVKKAKTSELDELFATLEGDIAQPGYFTYMPPTTLPPPPPYVPKIPEPRLLLRQIYKFEARCVIGIECTRDYAAAVYLTDKDSLISLTLADLIGLSGVIPIVDKLFSDNVWTAPIHLDSVLVDAVENAVTFCNYKVKRLGPTETETGAYTLELTVNGWTSLKRLFDCIESYFKVCIECSSSIQYLISRYSRHLTQLYKNRLQNVAYTDLVRYVNADLPQYIQQLDERRLPSDYRWSADV